jgi:hypothetical protein
MRLSKEGYGSLNEVKNFDVETFMDLIHYENYLTKYNNVMNELNRKK